MPRACIIVLDAVGAGDLPDAADYGSAGSNTLAHVSEAVGGLDVPALKQLGLGNIMPLAGWMLIKEKGLGFEYVLLAALCGLVAAFRYRAVRVLREPGALLDAWASAHSLADYEARRFHRWVRDPAELLQAVTDALADAGVEHALTLSSGARLVAPYGTDAERAWVLVPRNPSARLDEIARAGGLQPVEEGEVVTFLVTRERSPFLFRRQVRGLWVASDVQLYLDLSAWPQRGKEQAQHLRAERFGY